MGGGDGAGAARPHIVSDQLSHVFLLLGKTLFSRDEYAKALAVFEQSLVYYGPNAETYFMTGMCCSRMREYDVAVDSFTRTLL